MLKNINKVSVSGKISHSDAWLLYCNSFCSLKRKSALEEIMEVSVFVWSSDFWFAITNSNFVLVITIRNATNILH